MQSFAIRGTADGGQAVVLRSHDLSGCDYETLVPVSTTVAEALDRAGVVVWASQPPAVTGRPGIVLTQVDDDALVEVRADVADPTTVIGAARMPTGAAQSCLPKSEMTSIHWVVPPRNP